ncbi:hypothetical protein PanWU01x14_077340 [Parasponia andersonii]|uniref:Uncharacterized protein n=1 Tax=Parasponia andersonii TaxID=3476 RepID=A0A2P5DBP3_PARAD|nr:hypothetical protein PanWU01x14_077340 [Parasponia andersonii]
MEVTTEMNFNLKPLGVDRRRRDGASLAGGVENEGRTVRPVALDSSSKALRHGLVYRSRRATIGGGRSVYRLHFLSKLTAEGNECYCLQFNADDVRLKLLALIVCHDLNKVKSTCLRDCGGHFHKFAENEWQSKGDDHEANLEGPVRSLKKSSVDPRFATKKLKARNIFTGYITSSSDLKCEAATIGIGFILNESVCFGLVIR